MRHMLWGWGLIFALILYSPAHAQRLEPESMHAVLCDTAEHARHVVDLILDMDRPSAIKKVNEEAEKEDACIESFVLLYKGPETSRLIRDGTLFQVIKVLVVAYIQSDGWSYHAPQPRFTIVFTRLRAA